MFRSVGQATAVEKLLCVRILVDIVQCASETIQSSIQTETYPPNAETCGVYEYLIKTFAKQGDKILDTHLGSGSSRIAAYNLGFDFVGCEINKEFFDKQQERFINECQ